VSLAKTTSDESGPSLLTRVGSAVDRATLRLLSRAFAGGDGAPPLAPTRGPAELLEIGRRFYSSPETRQRYFAAPGLPAIREAARERLPGGAVVDLSFQSPFRPLFSPVADEYEGYIENRVVHARYLRHDRPARTLLCIHGWGGGSFWLEERAFAARWFYRSGFDVVLAVLPFHGLRTPAQVRFSGALFPTVNVFRTNEAFAQSLVDLRALVAWLRARGAPEIGVAGMSLGGYTAALLASCEPGLGFAIPMIPAVSMADLLWIHGEGTPSRRRAERDGVTVEALRAMFAVHTPLEHTPLVARERRFIVAGRADRITPPAQATMLWEHWERPAIHWFSGSHLLQFGRGDALRAIRRFLEGLTHTSRKNASSSAE